MKWTLIPGFLLWITFPALACTFNPISFCETPAYHPEHLVLSGQIVAKDDDGIDLKVLSIFRGVEQRDTIRIWDGTDFDCNGFFSMAASLLGAINDSVVLILPKIETIENTWDVLGDYRRPAFTDHTTLLHIKNGMLSGFIKGSSFAPPAHRLTNMEYTEFVNAWDSEDHCDNIVLSTEQLAAEAISVIYNNPVQTTLELRFNQNPSLKTIEVFSLQGIKQKALNTRDETLVVDFSNLASGVYWVRILGPNQPMTWLKILKV
ncbi:MAG: T9SS type A sorting domain-containing protein [Bacteroidota bacterium]